METLGLLLKAPRARRRRRDLIYFVEGLRLFLRVGWDLGYAWARTYEHLNPDFGDEMRERLRLEPAEPFARALRERIAPKSDPLAATWWGMIADLYESGASLGDALGAFAGALRAEHRRDLEQHARVTPVVTNLTLILFFLPATLALLLVPLLWRLWS